jgi:hypothetical protein
VEEALRFESPVQMLPRVTKVDVEVGGSPIPAGAVVMMMYGCADRDTAKFAAGEGSTSPARTLAPTWRSARDRTSARAQPWHAARRIAFETLFARCSDWALDTSTESPTHRELSMTLRGLSELHLTFTRRNPMSVSLDALQTIRYEVVDPGEQGVAVVTLDRPEARNAQNKRMTYEMNAAFDDASRRSDVKVIVLQADGPHFSSGHDLRDRRAHREFDLVSAARRVMAARARRGTWPGRQEVYFQMCWRWRNLPSPCSPRRRARPSPAG